MRTSQTYTKELFSAFMQNLTESASKLGTFGAHHSSCHILVPGLKCAMPASPPEHVLSILLSLLWCRKKPTKGDVH